MKEKLFERSSLILASIVTLFSFILFYSDTHMFLGSLFAAFIAGGLSWMTFIALRLLILTFRN